MDKKPNNPKSPNKTEKSENNDKSEKPQSTKTSQHASRYLIIGIILTLFNYVVYAILANFIFNNENLLWLAIFISTALSTILAYVLHSKITWKERDPGKSGVYKFFIWNILATVLINPVLTQLFSYITPIYDLGFNVSNNLHLPFTYDFIQSTGAFILTTIITMIINFLFYDKFVFGKTKKEPSHE